MTRPSVPLDSFEVCGVCTQLRGPFAWTTSRGVRLGLVQECRCERAAPRAATWPAFDFNQVVELCRVCGAEALSSGGKFYLWLCDDCADAAVAFNGSVGRVIVPISRHSLVNSVSLAGAQSRRPNAIVEFAGRAVEFVRQSYRVSDWTEHAVRRNLADAGLAERAAVPLLEYLDAVSRVDRALRFEECLAYITEPPVQA